MKKKKVRKAENLQAVNDKKAQVEEPQPKRAHPLQAWDDLMFMKRKGSKE